MLINKRGAQIELNIPNVYFEKLAGMLYEQISCKNSI